MIFLICVSSTFTLPLTNFTVSKLCLISAPFLYAICHFKGLFSFFKVGSKSSSKIFGCSKKSYTEMFSAWFFKLFTRPLILTFVPSLAGLILYTFSPLTIFAFLGFLFLLLSFFKVFLMPLTSTS